MKLNLEEDFSNKNDGKNLDYIVYASLLGRMFVFHFESAFACSNIENINFHAEKMKEYINLLYDFKYDNGKPLSIEEKFVFFFMVDNCLDELLDEQYYVAFDKLCFKLLLNKDYDILNFLSEEILLENIKDSEDIEYSNDDDLQLKFGFLAREISNCFKELYDSYHFLSKEDKFEIDFINNKLRIGFKILKGAICSMQERTEKIFSDHTLLDICLINTINFDNDQELSEAYSKFCIKLIENKFNNINNISDIFLESL